MSISGNATISKDPNIIRQFYKSDWKSWFGDESGARNGGPDDPRLALLPVDVKSAIHGKRNKTRPLVLFELAKVMVTGNQPDR